MLRRGWGVAEEPWRNPATKRSHLAAFKCASANACLNATVEVAVTSIVDKTTPSGPGVCSEGFAGFLWCAHRCPPPHTSLHTHSISACLLHHSRQLWQFHDVSSATYVTPHRAWNTSSHCAEGFSTSRTGITVEACSLCDSGAGTVQAVAWVLIIIVGIIVGLVLALWFAQRTVTDTAEKLNQLREVQADAKILFGNTNRFWLTRRTLSGLRLLGLTVVALSIATCAQALRRCCSYSVLPSKSTSQRRSSSCSQS